MHINEVVKYYNSSVDKLSVKNLRHEKIFISLGSLIPPKSRVLDIGCGAGLTTVFLAESGHRVLGCDISPKLIDYAKKHNAHENAKYVVTDATKMNIKLQFDAIVMADVLEHLVKKNIPSLFKNIKSFSHDQTKIYLNIPSKEVLIWLNKNKSDLLQVIDNPISIEFILEQFYRIGFVPSYFNLYWNHYQEYLFVTKKYQDDIFKNLFKGA